MHLNAYLTFNGQCEEAFKFYEQCLGGQIVAMFTHAGGACCPGCAGGASARMACGLNKFI